MLAKLWKNTALVLGLILALGLLVRTFRLSAVPLYGDELTMVYDGYSILSTGKDSTGKTLPLTFRMGAGRPGGYIYFSLPFVAAFGPGIWSERSLSIASGLGIIILMYFLGRKLVGKGFGILCSLVTALSYWDISLSRGGFEAHFALFLALLGLTSFIYSKQKPRLFTVWALSWGMAFLTYPTYKLVLPLFFLVLVWYRGWREIFVTKAGLLAVLVLVVFSLVALSQSFTANSEERFLSLNVFGRKELKESVIQLVNSDRTFAELTSGTPLFHNKVFAYGKVLVGNYVENLSPKFLFINGDENPRQNMAEGGMLYLVEFVTIFLGILFFASFNRKRMWLLILWLLISPAATALIDYPHALRNSFMLPPLVILSAAGVWKILAARKRIAALVIIVLWLSQVVFVLERVYFLAPNKFYSFWSGSARDAANLALINRQKVDYVFLSDKIDNSLYAYRVYGQVEPALVLDQNRSPLTISGSRYFNYDNVLVGSFTEDKITEAASLLQAKKVLFIGDINEKGKFTPDEIFTAKNKMQTLIFKSYRF